jgi:hypothetical protein
MFLEEAYFFYRKKSILNAWQHSDVIREEV